MPLADAFVSSDVLVLLIDEDVRPSRDLGGVDVKSIDIVKLGQLYALLSGKAFLEVLPEFPEVHAISDDGPWIYRFPAALESMLARFTAAEIASTAARWAEISEFELDRIDSATVAAMLGDLCRLARLAQRDGDHMYLWNCL
jgi:hypothetical protein